MNKLFDWPFLNEPIYRWAIFFIAMCLIAATWRIILGYMKG